jgi:phage major head subunit gpT-like protein
MIVNKAAIQAAFISIKTIFNKTFEAHESQYEKTTTVVPSSTKTEDYTWFGNFPRMRKWIGEKVLNRLSASKYSLTNEDFEVTIEVDRNDIEDDKMGQYSIQARDGGQAAKELPDDLINMAKDKAFINFCYDGQFFYDTDHPVFNPDTQEDDSVSNKLTTVLSWANLAAADASLGAAIIMMSGYKDEHGRKLKIVPDTLEVPSTLATAARMLATSEKFADDTINPYFGQITNIIVNPGLTSNTQWMLHCTSRPIKPFLFQNRKAPVFVSQTDLNSDDVFSKKKLKFGAEARAAAGYTLWQLSVGSTGTG